MKTLKLESVRAPFAWLWELVENLINPHKPKVKPKPEPHYKKGYKPQQHYMRGPGPAWRAKHSSQ